MRGLEGIVYHQVWTGLPSKRRSIVCPAVLQRLFTLSYNADQEALAMCDLQLPLPQDGCLVPRMQLQPSAAPCSIISMKLVCTGLVRQQSQSLYNGQGACLPSQWTAPNCKLLFDQSTVHRAKSLVGPKDIEGHRCSKHSVAVAHFNVNPQLLKQWYERHHGCSLLA